MKDSRDRSLPFPAASGCGGIGRRAAFRSPWGQPRGGSSPLIRTRRERPLRLRLLLAQLRQPLVAKLGQSFEVHGRAAEGARGRDRAQGLVLQGVGVTGKEAEERADAAGIVLNKNAIPFDPQKANIASGIRVGTPSVTTQGMGLDEMKTIARLIHRAVTEGDADPDHAVSKDVRAEVTDLVTRFPAYAR